MRSFIASLRNLVLPFGATDGTRIILDSDNGKIQVYTGSYLAAEIGEVAPGTGIGGFVSYGPTFPHNTKATLASGSLLFDWIGADPWQVAGVSAAAGDGPDYAELTVQSGSRHSGDPDARLILTGMAGEPSAVANFVDWNTLGPLDLQNGGRSQPRGLVAQTTTTTNSSYTVGEMTFISATADFKAGRAYRLKLYTLVGSDASGTAVDVKFRRDDDSRILGDDQAGYYIAQGGTNTACRTEKLIICNADETVTVNATLAREYGGGQVIMGADATSPCTFEITDIGAAADYAGVRTLA